METDFGPNSPEVRYLLSVMATLTPDEAKELDTARGTDSLSVNSRHDAFQKILKISGVEESPWPDYWSAAWSAVCDARTPETDAATSALYDTVSALVFRDLLDEDQFEALYAPFSTIFDGPAAEDVDDGETEPSDGGQPAEVAGGFLSPDQ